MCSRFVRETVYAGLTGTQGRLRFVKLGLLRRVAAPVADWRRAEGRDQSGTGLYRVDAIVLRLIHVG
jgi:hypothetical protein